MNCEVKVGDIVEIECMVGEPQYAGKSGTVEMLSVDAWGETQVWGTWGGCALYPGKDTFRIIGHRQ